MVAERSVSGGRCIVRYARDIRSANGDISNDNVGEKATRRKPKVFSATSIGGELVGT